MKKGFQGHYEAVSHFGKVLIDKIEIRSPSATKKGEIGSGDSHVIAVTNVGDVQLFFQ
jgi:hypothetical protein